MNDPFASAPADEAQAAPDPQAGAHDYSDGPPVEEPFAAPPAEAPAPAKKAPAKAAAKKPAVGTVSVDVKPNLLPLDEGKVVLTFKGGTGFDAPWIVIHAKDLDDALDHVSGDNASTLATIMERTQIAGKHFAGLAPAKPATGNSGGGQPAQRQAAPQAAQGAPNGEVRYCSHGEMRFRSGTSKAGKAYSAFFCSSGDRNDECKAQFLR